MKNPKELSSLVKFYRTEVLKLTQAELAKKMGKSRSFVKDIEAGDIYGDIGVEAVFALASALELPGGVPELLKAAGYPWYSGMAIPIPEGTPREAIQEAQRLMANAAELSRLRKKQEGKEKDTEARLRDFGNVVQDMHTTPVPTKKEPAQNNDPKEQTKKEQQYHR